MPRTTSILNRLLHRKEPTTILYDAETNQEDVAQRIQDSGAALHHALQNLRDINEMLGNAQNVDEHHNNEFVHREEQDEDGVHRVVIVRVNVGNIDGEEAQTYIDHILQGLGIHHEPKKKKDSQYGIFDELDESLDLKKIPGEQSGEGLLGKS